MAKHVVADFVQRRTSDRVGLVVFAGQSLTKAPPTTDTAVLLRQLDDVQLDTLPDGTAIGSGLATALTRLRRSKAKSRVVVLVTDGANNAGEIDPATATDLAKAHGGARLHDLRGPRRPGADAGAGAGSVHRPASSSSTAMVEVQIDEALLKRIAERTGGEFFRATDAGLAEADLRPHRPAGEVRDQADRLPALPRAVPAVLSSAAGAAGRWPALLFVGGLRVAPV